MLASTEISLALIHGSPDSIEDYFVAPSAPAPMSEKSIWVGPILQHREDCEEKSTIVQDHRTFG